MPRISFAILCAVLSAGVGCVSDVSSSDRYRELIGTAVYLHQDQVLWRNPPGEARLAPYEINTDMGTYTSHDRVVEITRQVPLRVAAVKRRKYLIAPPPGTADFAIVELVPRPQNDTVRAEVRVELLALE